MDYFPSQKEKKTNFFAKCTNRFGSFRIDVNGALHAFIVVQNNTFNTHREREYFGLFDVISDILEIFCGRKHIYKFVDYQRII